MESKFYVMKPSQPEVVVSTEDKDAVKQKRLQALVDGLTQTLKTQKAEFIKRQAAQEAAVETGDRLADYDYWNILSFGPFQFEPWNEPPNPPYLPHKVIAAGEPCYMVGLIWVNAENGPKGSLPGTVVLADRNYTMRFETINLTNVVDGPDFTHTATFGAPAEEFTWIVWEMETPDPGPAPKLYEATMTVDVNLGGQPFAAFASWHFDPDVELPFLWLPGRPAHWQYERPARFMIYRL